MSRSSPFRLIRALILTWLMMLVPALSAPLYAEEVSRPFSYIVGDWTDTLDRVDQQLRSRALRTDSDEKLRGLVKQVRDEARRISQDAEAAEDSLTKLLDALGPPPEEADA